MSILKKSKAGYWHWCPACECLHPLPSDSGGWKFDGDLERPTFTPSFKHDGKRAIHVDGRWTGEFMRDERGQLMDGTCHYFITAGTIQFCADSWHGRSDIVAMPPIPEGLVP